MLLRFLRTIFILLFVVAVFTGISIYIIQSDKVERQRIYDDIVTRAIETAISRSLYDATRTMEADIPHYRTIIVGQDESLLSVANRYNTTVDVIRLANGLLSSVEFGDGRTMLVIPEGVQSLVPPRRLRTYTAAKGDTLASVALCNNISQQLIEQDNPILARRGVIPGDIIFVADILL